MTELRLDRRGLIKELLERVEIVPKTVIDDWSVEVSSDPYAHLHLNVVVDPDLAIEILNNHIIRPEPEPHVCNTIHPQNCKLPGHPKQDPRDFIDFEETRS
jgi:hypothetical protein